MRHRLLSAFLLAALFVLPFPQDVAAEGKARAALDAGPALGVFGPTHVLVTASLEGLWGDRFHLAARVGGGAWSDVRATEESVELGLMLHPSDAVELLIGWRLGHAFFRKTQGFLSDQVDVHLLALEPVVRIGYELGPKWQLRITPLALSIYRDRVWGLSVGPEIGLCRRF